MCSSVVLLCLLSFPPQVLSLPLITLVCSFFELIIHLFESENLSLYKIQSTWLCIPINHLSKINCNYVISFDYYDNLLERIRILKLKILVLPKETKKM